MADGVVAVVNSVALATIGAGTLSLYQHHHGHARELAQREPQSAPPATGCTPREACDVADHPFSRAPNFATAPSRLAGCVLGRLPAARADVVALAVHAL